MTKVLRYLLFTIFLPFWWLQRLVPRKNNVWVFGAWYGHRFSDNSRYLYEYVKQNHPDIKAVWITRSKIVQKNVQKKGGLAFLSSELSGIYYCLIAKNVFLTSGKKDVNYLFINGARSIQLWHGSPLKKIGLDDNFSNANSFFQRNIVANFFPFTYEFNHDYVVSNAPIFTDKMASSFNLPFSKVLETGCPRNDVFYSSEQDAFNRKIRNRHKGCKLIYYLPTFRDYDGAKTLFTLPDFSLDKLEAFLELNNMVLVSKGHFVDNSLLENLDPNGRLIDLEDQNIDEVNFMLKDADLLITDYSSAYFDFLLTKKPIVFAAFDLNEYLAGSREMYFEYKNSIAGPIVKNWKELHKALQNIWENDEYRLLVKEKNILFNKYHDDQNSKRVFEAIKSI